MSETYFLLFAAIVLSAWAVFVVIAITVADLRIIALEKALRRHPHARKWRGVTRLRKQLVLHGDEKSVPRMAVRLALARFQENPSTRFVEVLPRIAFPQTTRQFFAAYRMLALAPFVRLRAGTNIQPTNHLWPTFAQPNILKSQRNLHYAFAAWFLYAVNLTVICYVGFVAMLGESSYLLTYIIIFTLWLAWSVCGYPAISARQKTAYLLLLPASLGYFLGRALVAPFSPLQRLRLINIRRRSVLS